MWRGILGYSNPRKALADHVDEDDKTDGVTIRDSIGREQNPVCINESGLYSLILSSKMPNAKKFKQGGIWLLYKEYAEKGYTSTKTHTVNGNDGKQHSKVNTYWTQKGRLFIYALLKSEGILPIMEQEQIA